MYRQQRQCATAITESSKQHIKPKKHQKCGSQIGRSPVVYIYIYMHYDSILSPIRTEIITSISSLGFFLLSCLFLVRFMDVSDLKPLILQFLRDKHNRERTFRPFFVIFTNIMSGHI